MFNKLELLYQSVNDTLQHINLCRFDDNTSEDERKVLDQQLIQYLSIKSKLLAQAPPNTFDKENLTRFTPVLVVDDSLVDREIGVNLLKEFGFSKILEAKEGQEALAIMANYNKNGIAIGLVLCDWNMPNMSGIEFLNVVRRDKDLWPTPVFLVTANHDKAHIITAVKAGVSGYVVKPIAPEPLKEKLKAFLPKDKQEVSSA